MLEAIEYDLKDRFKLDPKDAWIALAYTGNIEDALAWKEEVQTAYPDHDIVMDPLSLSVSCHIGPGSIAIVCMKKLPDEI